jgi:HEAT repeat protein
MTRYPLRCAALLACTVACGDTDRPPAPGSSDTAAPPARPNEVGAPPATGVLGLVERIPQLAAIVAAAPSAPSEAEWAELRDLVATSYDERIDSELSQMAERRLWRMERAALAAEDALNHPDPVIRARCAFALGDHGDPASAPALLLRLRVEQIRAVKLWLGDALLKLGIHCDLAIAAVEQRFAEPDLMDGAGAAAIDALRRAGIEVSDEPAWDEIRTGLDRLRRHYREEGFPLGAEPPPDDSVQDVPPRLAAILASSVMQLAEFQLKPVDEGREVLKNLGVRGLPFVAMGLDAKEPYVRAHAVEVLRGLGPAARSLEPKLLPLFDDPLTRLAAVQAAGGIRARGAAPRLREMLGDAARELELAAAAAAALGEIGDTESQASLAKIVADGGAPLDLRVYAAYGLALLESGEGEGREFLERAKAEGLYHEPTIVELLGLVARA